MEINNKNGKVIRHKSIVKAIFSLSSINPGAKIFTTCGIKSSKINVKIIKMKVNKDIADEANFIESSLPDATSFEENRGTKAEVKAPSANKLLNKFGSLNDTKNASETAPAPRKFAIIISLIKPVTLLIIVKPPKVAIDFIKDISLFLV